MRFVNVCLAYLSGCLTPCVIGAVILHEAQAAVLFTVLALSAFGLANVGD